MSMPPKFVALMSLVSEEDTTTLTFRGEDDLQYSCQLATPLLEELMRKVQHATLQRGSFRDMTTVTVVGSHFVRSAKSRALALQTLEAGTIAFAITDEAVEGLLRGLSRWAANPDPKQKH